MAGLSQSAPHIESISLGSHRAGRARAKRHEYIPALNIKFVVSLISHLCVCLTNLFPHVYVAQPTQITPPTNNGINWRSTMKIRLARIGVCAAALTLGMSLASAAAFAQFGSYYPNDRKLNDNGSVYEPSPGLSASTRQPSRREHLVNYAPQISRTKLRQYWPNDRRPDDNGSVDEPGPIQ
jgi:hypothetical protein